MLKQALVMFPPSTCLVASRFNRSTGRTARRHRSNARHALYHTSGINGHAGNRRQIDTIRRLIACRSPWPNPDEAMMTGARMCYEMETRPAKGWWPCPRNSFGAEEEVRPSQSDSIGPNPSRIWVLEGAIAYVQSESISNLRRCGREVSRFILLPNYPMRYSVCK
jgi:hypothetical protein